MSAILYDARGNELKIGFPDMVTNETITDARPVSAVLAALNAEVIMDLNGASVATFDVRTAAGALTCVFEGTIDGVNYMALPAFADFQLLAAAALQEVYVGSVVIATTTSGIYHVGVSGFRRVRCRISAYTSGNITVAARASVADQIIIAKAMPSTLVVEVDGGANAIATITLPAVAGLFHYITHISWMRHCTAALVGTGAINITTTNLPGALKWRVGNAIAVGEHKRDVEYTPTTPLKSSVVGTATTVVAAAPGAAVLWTGVCSYYVGA
jgi:hypothetical protein